MGACRWTVRCQVAVGTGQGLDEHEGDASDLVHAAVLLIGRVDGGDLRYVSIVILPSV